MDYSEYEKFAQPVNLLPMGSYFKTVPEDHSVRWRIIGREDSLIEIERYQDNLLVTSQIDPDVKVYHCDSRGRIPGVDPGADPVLKLEHPWMGGKRIDFRDLPYGSRFAQSPTHPTDIFMKLSDSSAEYTDERGDTRYKRFRGEDVVYDVSETPPIGLRPEKIARDIAHNRYISERSLEILDAMERYNAARKPIPGEWFDELRTLIEERIIQQGGKFKPTEKDNEH